MRASNGLHKTKNIDECISELECLLRNTKGSDYNYQIEIEDSAFNTLKRKTKALEIIIDRNIDTKDLQNCMLKERFGRLRNGRLAYNSDIAKEAQLTESEYDLLKEVLL